MTADTIACKGEQMINALSLISNVKMYQQVSAYMSKPVNHMKQTANHMTHQSTMLYNYTIKPPVTHHTIIIRYLTTKSTMSL